MKFIFFILFLFFVTNIFGNEKVLGRMYFTNFLGHVHKNMSKDSTSLTIVQCSHSVKVLDYKNLIPDWTYVQVGEDKGFVQSHFLTTKKPECFQGKYPRFYNEMNLDITQMYYWGKLYDHYFQGKTKVK